MSAALHARLCSMSAPLELPLVVMRAFDLSRRQGFVRSCRNETGRLLASLAASRSGTLAECGTGCGVGSAWLRSGLREDSRVVTAELNKELAAAVGKLFAGDEKVTVLHADWSDLERYAPFSLLFIDVREPKRSGIDVVAGLMEPGGMVVLDDFTPCTSWPPVFDGRVDTIRQSWLSDSRFTSVELMVASDAAVILASRR
jgi:predicted O-methyltransferase YrrM